MKAVILAAGLGQRLTTLTQNKPKALVEVAGRPLLEYLIEQLNAQKINDVVLVNGYLSEQTDTWLKKHAPHVKTIYNKDYAKGSIVSLLCAENFADSDFLLTNVDHIYHPELFARASAKRSEITAMCDFDRQLVADDMKIKLNNERGIKKIHKQLHDYDCGYIGMTFVPKTFLTHYWKAAHELHSKIGEMASVEWVLGLLAEQNQHVGICDLSGFGWAEIDSQDDLPAAINFVQKSAIAAA